MIGYTTVTFRDMSIQENVRFAKDSGMECLEWGGDVHITDIDSARYARELCQSEGIAISAYGSYYTLGQGNISDWAGVVAIASELGAPVIRVWLGKKGSDKFSNMQFDELVAEAQAMADVAVGYNIIIASECHQNTYNDTTDSALKFLIAVGRDNYRTYYQSRYLDMATDLDKLDRLFDYVDNTHISFSEVTFNQRHFSCKKDKNALEKVISKLVEKDYKGNIIIEFCKKHKTKWFLRDIARLRECMNYAKGDN